MQKHTVARDLMTSVLIWKLLITHRRYPTFKLQYRKTAIL